MQWGNNIAIDPVLRPVNFPHSNPTSYQMLRKDWKNMKKKTPFENLCELLCV